MDRLDSASAPVRRTACRAAQGQAALTMATTLPCCHRECQGLVYVEARSRQLFRHAPGWRDRFVQARRRYRMPALQAAPRLSIRAHVMITRKRRDGQSTFAPANYRSVTVAFVQRDVGYPASLCCQVRSTLREMLN